MANHNQSGGRNAGVFDDDREDDRSSWRPQDQPSPEARRRAADDDLARSWRDRGVRDDERGPGDRDARRWDSRGDLTAEDREPAGRGAERYGQGRSGYGAGRYGDDRLQPPGGRGDPMPSAGSFEDRYRDLGTDDRLAGRGRASYWQDRIGYDLDHYGGYSGRDFDAERRGLARSGHGYDERMSYPAGSYSRGYGASPSGTPDAAPRDAEPELHVHRGTGPHRGKGPAGYQRSDERIRELVCESLTDDDQIDATHIEVAVSHGEVTLSGTALDRRAKRDAEDCAYSVSGVRDVQNLLRVVGDDRPFIRGSLGQTSSGTSPGRSEPEASAQDKKYRA